MATEMATEMATVTEMVITNDPRPGCPACDQPIEDPNYAGGVCDECLEDMDRYYGYRQAAYYRNPEGDAA